MASGRIRRTAQRGLAAAVLGWLGVATASVLMAPGAAAAPSATIEIRNLTPPVASVDAGGTVTFVNRIPAENRGGIQVLPTVGVSATVFTDVSLNFFGQERKLAPDQSASWTFSAPATTGTITYAYRVVPQASLPLGVTAQQVIDRTLASLPALPLPTPYVVQTVAPVLPNLPSANLPQLPTVSAPLPGGGNQVVPPTTPPVDPPPTPSDPTGAPAPTGVQVASPGDQYAYGTGAGAPRMSPSDVVAAAAFDPSRYFVPGTSIGGADRAGSGGAGGVVGSYDGAAVPVFGQLAGLDDGSLHEDAVAEAAAEDAPARPLPAAALAAVVALAAVTAALIRTHQASRASR